MKVALLGEAGARGEEGREPESVFRDGFRPADGDSGRQACETTARLSRSRYRSQGQCHLDAIT